MFISCAGGGGQAAGHRSLNLTVDVEMGCVCVRGRGVVKWLIAKIKVTHIAAHTHTHTGTRASVPHLPLAELGCHALPPPPVPALLTENKKWWSTRTQTRRLWLSPSRPPCVTHRCAAASTPSPLHRHKHRPRPRPLPRYYPAQLAAPAARSSSPPSALCQLA